MKQTVLQANHILYEKKGGEVSERTILPLNVPNNNVLAFDVSDLTQDQLEQVQTQYKAYIQYKDDFMKSMLSFDKWLDHVQSDIDPKILKYRSFDPSKITAPKP
jgi:hypothetical protein